MSEPDLAFDAVVTLGDMVALHQRLLASPGMRAGRLKREAAGVLASAICAPFGLMIAMAVVGLGDRGGPSLGESVTFLLHRQPWLLAEAALFVAGVVAIAMAAQRLLVKNRLRRVFSRILRMRPDVDMADPQLSFRTRVVVNDEGMESRSAIGTTLVRWSSVDRWEEKDGRLLVLGKAMNGFCVNTAHVDPAMVERLRSRLAAALPHAEVTTARKALVSRS